MTALTAALSPSLVEQTMDTPIGALRLVAGRRGMRAVLWPGEVGTRVARSLSTDSPAGAHATAHTADGRLNDERDPHELLATAQKQLTEYFEGSRQSFDVPLDLVGTAFQQAAWHVLGTIPFGQTMSYREQAVALGDPGRARAVGAANGRNPLSILVPCHRVVATSGALTGFAGGVDTKAWLLRHERQVVAGG